MRIIRPLDNMAAVTASNAPDDDVQPWAVVGRDLFSYESKPVFDVYQNSLFIIGNNNSLYKQNLVNGDTQGFAGFNKEFGAPIKISANPSNGMFVASFSGYSVFYSAAGVTLANSQTLFGGNRAVREIAWEAGVAYCVVGDGYNGHIYKVDTSAWTSELIYSATGADITSICTDGVNLFAATERNPNSDIIFYAKVVKLSPAGSVLATHTIGIMDGQSAFVVYNSARSEVVAFKASRDTITLNSSDLTLKPAPQIIPLRVFFTPKPYPYSNAIKTTDTHLITRSLSTSPVWNFYNLSDYSLDSNLTIPALPDRGEGIAIGTNYTVVQQNQGIAIVDNTTRDLVAQQNPNVIKGDTYIYNDKVYEVLTNNNDQPDEGAAKDPSPTWLDLGAINRLRMLDNKIDSVTRGNGSLNITIDAKQALNGIALFNVTAATVQITMTDGTYGLVYDTGEVLMRDSSQIRGWNDWFFSSRPKMRDLARIDLPTFPNAIVEVTLTGDNVSLGEIVIGRVQKIGETQYGGTSVGIIDSSIKERDDFGNFVIAERPFSKRVEFDVHVPTSGISGVQNILASYRAKPVVYVGAEGEEALVVFGFYRDFQINYTSYSIAASTITVEGL